MSTGITRSLYRAADGTQAVLEKPLGLIPPPTLRLHRPMVGPVELAYVGTDDVDESPSPPPPGDGAARAPLR